MRATTILQAATNDGCVMWEPKASIPVKGKSGVHGGRRTCRAVGQDPLLMSAITDLQAATNDGYAMWDA